MVRDDSGKHTVKITAEVIVEILDEATLEREALTYIDTVEFAMDEDSETTVDHAREEERQAVLGDPVAALELLVTPSAMVASLTSVTTLGAEYHVEEIDQDDDRPASLPDFAGLFVLCGCGEPVCDACASDSVTPRTAAVLWSAGQVLADFAYDDVLQHGDDPVDTTAGLWSVFDEFPRITWHQDAIWRRQAARSFDDVAADLASGNWPQPRSPAEEMALHLMLQHAEATVIDGASSLHDAFAHLPTHEDDFDWTLLYDVLFQDVDILDLFDAQLDGIEDPDSDRNRLTGMGDYRPDNWHTAFLNAAPRDPSRPFRR